MVVNARVKNPFAKNKKNKLKPNYNGFKSDANSSNTNGTTQKVDPNTHLISQELKFAKILAGNDATLRTKNIKNLKKWLTTRSSSSFPFTDDDFLRIWKGLFYCMWMSDKMLVQEALADDLGSLIHCFSTPKVGIQFFKAFLNTMIKEWYGIDQWRIDKFMMLVRRMLRQAFVLLKSSSWDADDVKSFRDVIGKTVLVVEMNNTSGLTMHITDIYLEELAKVSIGEVPKITVSLLIKPFVNFIAAVQDRRLSTNVCQNIFFYLIKQSDMGREYQEKFEIWKQVGCPTSNPEDIEIEEENVGESDSSDEETNVEENGDEDEGVGDDEELNVDPEEVQSDPAFDPRAGDVNVDIPEIEFRPQGIIGMFEKIMFKPFVYRKNIPNIKNIICKYKQYMNGQYPFALRNVPMVSEIRKQLPDVNKKALELNKADAESQKLSQEYRKAYKRAKRMSKERREEYMKAAEERLSNGLLNNKIEEDKDKASVENDSDSEVAEPEVETETKPLKKKNNKTKDNLKKRKLSVALKSESVAEEIKSNINSPSPKKQKKLEKSKLESNKTLEKPITKMQRQSLNKSILEIANDSLNPTSPKVPIHKKLIGETENEENIVIVNGITPKKEILQQRRQSILKVKKLSNKNSPKPKDVSPIPDAIVTSPKIASTPQTKKQKRTSNVFDTSDDWNEPLKDGEVEFFLPSRKSKLAVANKTLNSNSPTLKTPNKSLIKSSETIIATPTTSTDTEILITPKKMFLPNPFAKQANTSTKKIRNKNKSLNHTDPALSKILDSAEKRVKIALHKNITQETDEYIKTLESSPQVPYDSTKKPSKGLLKPNSMPSPINPFYMKKIGLNFDA